MDASPVDCCDPNRVWYPSLVPESVTGQVLSDICHDKSQVVQHPDVPGSSQGNPSIDNFKLQASELRQKSQPTIYRWNEWWKVVLS